MFEQSGDTSTGFIAQLRAGNADAWQEFHRLYVPVMMARCRRIGFQDADADDLVGDFFVRLHTALCHRKPDETGGFEHGPPNYRFRYFLRTLFKVACNELTRNLADAPDRTNYDALCHDLVASFDDERSLSFDDPDVRRAAPSYLVGLERELEAKGKLNVFQLLLLAEGLEWNSTEIAQELGMTSSNVRQTHRRYLQKLRDRVLSGQV